MTDFIPPAILDQFKSEDTPLRIAQGFIDVVNADVTAVSSVEEKLLAVTKSTLVAVASLEARIYALMRAVGARDVGPAPSDEG